MTAPPPGCTRRCRWRRCRGVSGSHLLRSLRSPSRMTCIALGEQARRLEEWRLHKARQDAKMKELILKDSKATKLMAQLEEDLQLARSEAGRLREEKAKAEEAAAEAARKAAEEAEAARTKAVVTAREEAISGFLDGGGRPKDTRSGCPRLWRPPSMSGARARERKGWPERANNIMMGASFSPKPSSIGGWLAT
ncbi:unnamed protein product [Cuscuta europaea]|uniref:Uncharacterized protein n=1 Tax=Cuscuta europaea TaxID=41803 RepID=A0A9P1DZF3_CUSEU|nr:unnamed protein product [Cuscuta europaea]